MTTAKDSASATAAPAIPTMLPTTCGEETDLPGVPRVGCVAAVSYKPDALFGFAASIIATADSVAILGPDLDQRRYGRHCLFTRHLWRPASLVESAAAGGQSVVAAGSASISSPPSSPLTAATTARMLSHADGSGVNIIALTACSLSPSLPLPPTDTSSNRTTHQEQQRQKKSAVSDAVAVAVAWADVAMQHHVAVLVLHLKHVLSPSWAGEADGSLVRVVAHDALPLPPAQSVLRLFYHPAMTAPPSQAATDAAEVSAPSKHVMMCSLFSSWTGFSVAGQPSHADSNTNNAGGAGPSGGTVGNVVKKSNVAVLNGTGGGGAAESPTSSASPGKTTATAANPRRLGQLRFITVSVAVSHNATAPDTDGDEALTVTATPSSLSDVAPWLLAFQVDRVVCAFTVQSASTRVIAAAGTTDGRVFLLGPTSHRLVRRVSGPVADMTFVRTRPSKADTASRNAVVDEIIEDAVSEDALKNVSFTSAADAEFARRDESAFVALVVLDSAGHLLVLRAVNSGAAITQTVPDLPQIITLANGQKQTLTFVSPSMANLEEAPQVSSKNFLDLSSLRHFIGRSRAAPPRKAGRSTSPSNAPLASSSLTATPVNQSFAASSEDEPILSGHILSRGLLCVANIESGKGGSELVVSTMGQVIVSVPFNPTEGCFRIAGFTVTPAPMFYVGFVDFFADGNPTLVMAGLKNVLVASRPPSTLRERAQLLLRLLSKKELERRHSDSDDGVEG
ncbi:hypothetical protein ABB37_00694 [Leptomonas pyrrhocoris]|uniref:Uncharacterized protein n=1 Tax=Leptomonas pyrrhocoris TaxID=157538 RepID=A0A0M9GAY8_LEPPY|nr:hypothetical protein ABB37_00694 [Leptomonas pyrrhocoris]KPA86557.1 hypothetical protein ABB37_00694 [Leptomonas pyrrhocoris]|eukprot:XP_015664996.1 hypothetical protein ABB37_00694 [Leptomonas pyrrhocoris]